MSIVHQVLHFLENHQTLVTWITVGSLLFFVVSLAIIPWLIVQMPADYFEQPGKERSPLFAHDPVRRLFFKIFKNVLAAFIFMLGIVLLVLPGQGLLTILIALVIADFPGKHRLINSIVRRPGIIKSINWLRAKANKKPIELQPLEP